MTKSEAIHRRVLRCRPGHNNAYVTTHEALLAEAKYLQQTRNVPTNLKTALAIWALVFVLSWVVAGIWGNTGQIIKGWFA